MPVPFAILALDHVVLRAADPARLEKFYVEVLGCPVDLRQEHIKLVQLRAGRSQIDIVPAGVDAAAKAAAARAGANVDHICLQIDPWDPDAISGHLTANGVEHDAEVKSRYGAEGRGPSIYLTDPEGNRVELKGPGAR